MKLKRNLTVCHKNLKKITDIAWYVIYKIPKFQNYPNKIVGGVNFLAEPF